MLSVQIENLKSDAPY